jgi:hypothetical protein
MVFRRQLITPLMSGRAVNLYGKSYSALGFGPDRESVLIAGSASGFVHNISAPTSAAVVGYMLRVKHRTQRTGTFRDEGHEILAVGL